MQVNYAADAITKMINSGAKSMVLKPEVLKNYIEYVKKHMQGKTEGTGSMIEDCVVLKARCSGSRAPWPAGIRMRPGSTGPSGPWTW